MRGAQVNFEMIKIISSLYFTGENLQLRQSGRNFSNFSFRIP